jgi:transmembrane sensor
MKIQRKVKREVKEMKSEHWEIITKYLAHEELSAEEKSEFDLLSADEDFRKILDQSANVFEKTDLFFDLKQYNTEKAWEKVNIQVAKKRTNFLHVSWVYRVAAIFLLVVTTSIAIWQFGFNNHEICEFATTQFDFSNPEIVLPDGSKVKLNHSSKLTYPEQFKGNNREVILTGEAFFNVTPNREKPFIIKANGASIKVVGTSFNVYAYNESSTVEVIVKTGKVELHDKDLTQKVESEKVLLLPGEKGIFNKLNKTIAKENTFNSNNLSWVTHEMEFKYTRLADVFQTMQRVYNIQIKVDPGVDLNQKLSATFSQQQPEYIMEVIAMTQNLNLKKGTNNQYIIQIKN